MSRLAIRNRIASLLLVLGPLTSLAVSPFSNYDPINLIKLLIVVSFAGAILALLLYKSKWDFYLNYRLVLIAVIGFVTWLIVSLLVSETPINQQVWGVFGRGTGLLTYISLIIVLFATAVVSVKTFYHKLIDALVLTSIPMTLYALVQVAGKEPIGWSEIAPFATLLYILVYSY